MPAAQTMHPSLLQTYQERASIPGTSPLAAYFLKLIAAKRSNLCVSADVTSSRELLQLAEEVGDQICLLKTHADIIQDFGHKTAQDLQAVAKRKGFLIFEDRKFGDIGNTVQMQYTAGPLQIARWANIVNAHIFPGPAIVTALATAADNALAAYNTSVETQISGPPVLHEDGEEQETEEIPTSAEASTAGEQDGDCLSSADEESEDDDDKEDEAVHSEDDGIGDLNSPTGRRLSTPDVGERKFSVVSVSTTISTKTEQISPQPTPLHHRGLSQGLDSGATEETDVRKAVRSLGEPPMARSLLLLAQMSSAGNLMNDAYTAHCLETARKRPDFVMGFIAQSSLNAVPGDNFITMTPGVQIGSKGDALGQTYNTPEHVVTEKGTDVVIVGRGVYGAQDRKAAAEEYRSRAWKAYETRIGMSA
ncbi:Orotidine 5'-phosphate decarboxylase [Sphaceloma murrayae]|uniref:Orotidine 5'-phosphate decarboxylase n=1 Tax=Sphaceloma murrayae TaxID=2082308 RepID=A0A2K1QQT2_9PEZI|nr:Orotidine 5'-phosphate decarboxylase [Sphaceloma murrayae]